MTKSETGLTETKSIVQQALRNSNAFGSVADDFGTDSRTCKSTIQRILMQSIKSQEFSNEMVSTVLLGYSSNWKSHATTFCFVSTALTHVKNSLYIVSVNSEPEMESVHPENEEFFDTLVDVNDGHHISTGSIPLISQKQLQHINYEYRGKELRNLSLFEYTAMVEVVKIVKERPKKGMAGRPRNTTFPFDENHPSHTTHSQRLLSKFRIPVIAGMKFPSFVNDAVEGSNWAEFVATTIIPWGPHNEQLDLSFQNVKSVLLEMKSQMYTDCVSRFRYLLIETISTSMKIPSSVMNSLQKYRYSQSSWEDFKGMCPDKETSQVEISQSVIIPTLSFQIDPEVSQTQRIFQNTLSSIPTNDCIYHASIYSRNLKKVSKIWNAMRQATVPAKISFQAKAIELNSLQQEAVNIVMAHINEHKQLKLILHGGPGTGKSTTINSIIQHIGSNSIVCCAPTGIAASVLRNGRTIDSLFHTFSRNPTQLSYTTLIKMRNDFKDCKLLVVDECSMISPKKLYYINQRLQLVFNNQLSFGGLSVVLCGDYFQLPPVKSKSWHSLIVNGTENPEEMIAANTLKDFYLLELAIQNRSNDSNHNAIIEQCRIGFTAYECIQNYPTFDFENDTFEGKTILTSTNAIRCTFNLEIAKIVSKRKGLPLIMWDKPMLNVSSGDRNGFYRQFPEASQLFIQGENIMLLENINVSLGLANGTILRLHSITLNPDTARMDSELLSRACPGHPVKLLAPPLSVNVEIKNQTNWPRDLRLEIPGKNVIPIMVSSQRTCSIKFQTKDIKLQEIPFTLCYALTYNKCQGQTLDSVVLDTRYNRKMPLTFEAFYVGLTRVRSSENIRFLPMNTTKDISQLQKLKTDPTLNQWFTNYVSSPTHPNLQVYRENSNEPLQEG
jgi:hypothetical protein